MATAEAPATTADPWETFPPEAQKALDEAWDNGDPWTSSPTSVVARLQALRRAGVFLPPLTEAHKADWLRAGAAFSPEDPRGTGKNVNPRPSARRFIAPDEPASNDPYAGPAMPPSPPGASLYGPGSVVSVQGEPSPSFAPVPPLPSPNPAPHPAPSQPPPSMGGYETPSTGPAKEGGRTLTHEPTWAEALRSGLSALGLDTPAKVAAWGLPKLLNPPETIRAAGRQATHVMTGLDADPKVAAAQASAALMRLGPGGILAKALPWIVNPQQAASAAGVSMADAQAHEAWRAARSLYARGPKGIAADPEQTGKDLQGLLPVLLYADPWLRLGRATAPGRAIEGAVRGAFEEAAAAPGRVAGNVRVGRLGRRVVAETAAERARMAENVARAGTSSGEPRPLGPGGPLAEAPRTASDRDALLRRATDLEAKAKQAGGERAADQRRAAADLRERISRYDAATDPTVIGPVPTEPSPEAEPSGALPAGAAVSHPQLGEGEVVSFHVSRTTPRGVYRVRFPDGKVWSLPAEDLTPVRAPAEPSLESEPSPESEPSSPLPSSAPETTPETTASAPPETATHPAERSSGERTVAESVGGSPSAAVGVLHDPYGEELGPVILKPLARTPGKYGITVKIGDSFTTYPMSFTGDRTLQSVVEEFERDHARPGRKVRLGEVERLPGEEAARSSSPEPSPPADGEGPEPTIPTGPFEPGDIATFAMPGGGVRRTGAIHFVGHDPEAGGDVAYLKQDPSQRTWDVVPLADLEHLPSATGLVPRLGAPLLLYGARIRRDVSSNGDLDTIAFPMRPPKAITQGLRDLGFDYVKHRGWWERSRRGDSGGDAAVRGARALLAPPEKQQQSPPGPSGPEPSGPVRPPTATDPGGADPPGVVPGTRVLLTHLLNHLEMTDRPLGGALLMQMAERAFGGSLTSGRYDSRDVYDALETAVNLHVRSHPDDYHGAPAAVLGALRALQARLPTQTLRTGEQLDFQQFSTPPTLAFVAAHALDVSPFDLVLEPSAGTGDLALWATAAGASVRVNEISARRRGLLEIQGYVPTAFDAEHLHDLMPLDLPRPTAILMNPPFSATGGRVKSNAAKFGAEHLRQALLRLEEGGRLVAITGRTMRITPGMSRGHATTGTAFRPWWTQIMQRYHVRANLTIPGAEYGKYGTEFPTQLIVIDKTGATPGSNWAEQTSFIEKGEAGSLEEALDALESIAKDRSPGAVAPGARGVPRGPGGESPAGGGGGELSRPDGERPGPGGPGRAPRPAGPGEGGPPASGGEPGAGEGTPEGRPGGRVRGPSDVLPDGRPAGEAEPGGEGELRPPLGETPGEGPAGGRPEVDAAVERAVDKLVARGMPRDEAEARVRKLVEGRIAASSGASPSPQGPGAPASEPRAEGSGGAAGTGGEGSGTLTTGRAPAEGGPSGGKGPGPDRSGYEDAVRRLTDAGVTRERAEEMLRGAQSARGPRPEGDVRNYPEATGGDPFGDLDALISDADLDRIFDEWSISNRELDDLVAQAEAEAKGAGKGEAPRETPGTPGTPETPERREPTPAERAAEQDAALRRRQEEQGGTFVDYVPQKYSGGVPHPAKIVETASMAAVEPPDLSYAPNLPQSVVDSGELSNIQLEAISYAGQRHALLLPDGRRAGFFIGDGTGFGKGRELAGLIWDNWLAPDAKTRGSRRSIWVSVSKDMLASAQDDFQGIGAIHDPPEPGDVPLADYQKFPSKGEIDLPEGVVFLTYSGLRARFDQVKRWLAQGREDAQPVVMLDEAHKAKNALSTGRGGATDIGKKIVKLQAELPGARVVYSSATGMTEVRNMAYMTRLGLWGPGTAFPEGFAQFWPEIEGGGVGAMEMAARDMKALGMYVRRQISFEGVTYAQTEHKVTPEQRTMYDAAAAAWQVVMKKIEDAMGLTGAEHDSQARSQARSNFWGAHQRFFNLLITAIKAPTVIAETERALDEGKSVVVSLINTAEAQTQRQVSKSQAEGTDLEDLDFSPRLILAQMIDNCFPIHTYVEETDPDTGETAWVPLLDESGRPVVNREALEMKRRLLESLESLVLPDAPLDQFINHFARRKQPVAELTGRKKVLRRNPSTGKTEYVKRADAGTPADKVNLEEMRKFQAGEKRVAILSQAASTGISLHASVRAENRQLRHHVTWQVAWSADEIMQALGRTHRSHQAQPPEYDLLRSNIGGESRFIAAAAKRLESLGALTTGQRGSVGGDLSDFNFEGEYGEAAVEAIYRGMANNEPAVAGRLPAPALDILDKMGLVQTDANGRPSFTGDPKNVKQFLNRLLALELDLQEPMFDLFHDAFEHAVEQAKQTGQFDAGVQELRGLAIRHMAEPSEVAREKTSGARTYHYQLGVRNRTHALPLEEAEGILRREAGNGRDGAIFRQKRSKRLVVAYQQGQHTDSKGNVSPRWTLQTTRRRFDWVPEGELAQKYDRLEGTAARTAWAEEIAKIPAEEETEHHLIGGAILPLWDRIKGEAVGLKVSRATTDAGERVVGMEIPEGKLGPVLRAIGVSRSFRSPEEVFQGVLRGGSEVRLAGGLLLRRVAFRGGDAIELRASGGGAPPRTLAGELRRWGLGEEIVDFRSRWFVPTDEERGVAALERLLDRHPVLEEESAEGDVQGYPMPFSKDPFAPRPGRAKAEGRKANPPAPEPDDAGGGDEDGGPEGSGGQGSGGPGGGGVAPGPRPSGPRPSPSGPSGEAGGASLNAATLGAAGLASEDVVPAVRAAGASAREALSGMKTVFSPATASNSARIFGGSLREYAARGAVASDRVRQALLDSAKALDVMGWDAAEEFYWRAETGRPQVAQKGATAAELDDMAALFHRIFEIERMQLRLLDPAKDLDVIENYLPHMFKDPNAALAWLRRFFSRRSLTGTEDFLKPRFYATLRDAMEEGGLEPISRNPAVLVLHKHMEIEKYLAGMRALEEAKANGISREIHVFAKVDPGWAVVPGKHGAIYGPPTVPVKEAFDAQLMGGLVRFARGIGVAHERVMTTPGGVWGLSSESKGLIQTKFAGPEQVLAHEIGHQLDAKYGLRDYMKNPTQGGASGRRMNRARVRIAEELRRLADLHLAGVPNPTPSQIAYQRRYGEQLATIVEAYVHAPELFKATAPTAFARFEKFLGTRPELAALKDVKPSLELGEHWGEVEHGGRNQIRKVVMPVEAVRLLENHLSPGLRNLPGFGPFIRGYFGLNNVLNLFQLGWSAFHLVMTTGNATFSRAGLGLNQLAAAAEETGTAAERGARALAGAQSLGTSVVPGLPALQNAAKGSRVMREWLRSAPGAEFADVLEGLAAAGARRGMDARFRTDFWRAAKDARAAGNPIGAALRLPFAATEFVSGLILDRFVPAVKFGMFADAYPSVVDRLEARYASRPGGVPWDVYRSAMAELWDSTDNRFGLAVQDNKFWPRVVTEAAQMLFRSHSFKFGTLGELGGGAYDMTRMLPGAEGRSKGAGGSGFAAREEWQSRLSHKTAFTFGMLCLAGAAGTLMFLHRRGRMPRNVHEAYQYVEPFTYMKDVHHLLSDVFSLMRGDPQLSWLSGGTAPALQEIGEQFRNKDDRGVEIAERGAGLPAQLLQRGGHLAGKVRPLQWDKAREDLLRGVPLQDALVNAIGIPQVPKYLSRTPFQAKVAEWGAGTRQERATTREEARHRAMLRGFRDALGRGEDVHRLLGPLIREHAVSREEAKDLLRRAIRGRIALGHVAPPPGEEDLGPTLQDLAGFVGMPADEALDAYRVADPEERAAVRLMLFRKVSSHAAWDSMVEIPPRERTALKASLHRDASPEAFDAAWAAARAARVPASRARARLEDSMRHPRGPVRGPAR